MSFFTRLYTGVTFIAVQKFYASFWAAGDDGRRRILCTPTSDRIKRDLVNKVCIFYKRVVRFALSIAWMLSVLNPPLMLGRDLKYMLFYTCRSHCIGIQQVCDYSGPRGPRSLSVSHVFACIETLKSRKPGLCYGISWSGLLCKGFLEQPEVLSFVRLKALNADYVFLVPAQQY